MRLEESLLWFVVVEGEQARLEALFWLFALDCAVTVDNMASVDSTQQGKA
jgi:hypothetical protein